MEYLQSFEASITIVFVVKSVKECMTIFLLSNELYNEWGEILLMWEQGKILDGFGKLPLKPQLMEKFAFNCLVSLEESHMQKLMNNLKLQKITMRNYLASGGNPHLLTMAKFCYNVKKKRVIQNEIMVHHNRPQPIVQSPQPYIEVEWKTVKTLHNYNKSCSCFLKEH